MSAVAEKYKFKLLKFIIGYAFLFLTKKKRDPEHEDYLMSRVKKKKKDPLMSASLHLGEKELKKNL